MLWRKCDKLLTNAQGKVINCDFNPCSVYVVLGIVEQPLDSNWEIIPCQNAYCYHVIAHIVNGHYCWQYRPQKQVDIAFHKPKKDETVFQADIEEWAGHNRNHVKVYFISDCYEDYNEFQLMYNDVPQGQSVQSYRDNKACSKKLKWWVNADFYRANYELNPYGTIEEYIPQDDWYDLIQTIFYTTSPIGALNITVIDDSTSTQDFNNKFYAGREELLSVEDSIQGDFAKVDDHNYGVVESQRSQDLCCSFSFTCAFGSYGYGYGPPSFIWNTSGYIMVQVGLLNDTDFENVKSIKFRYRFGSGDSWKIKEVVASKQGNQIFEKIRAPFVPFGDIPLDQNVWGSGQVMFTSPTTGNRYINIELQLIEFVF